MGRGGTQYVAADQFPEDYKAYLEERRWLFGFEHQISQSFDKYMLTLSAGALGLSITFIKQLAPNPLPKTLPYLYFSWGLFTLALLIVLMSLLFSQHAFHRQSKAMDKAYADQQDARSHHNIWVDATDWANWLSIIFFTAGVVCLMVFSSSNPPQP